jgi:hypothetical protein
MDGALLALTLDDVVAACQDETRRFRRGERTEGGACLELFRRAICGRDSAAWEAIIAQYRGIVLAWVRQGSAPASAREPDDFWVGRAFERLWSAIGPERFDHFAGVPALLKYLKMCVHSVVLDDVRARAAAQTAPLEASEREAERDAPDAEVLAVQRLSGDELWAAIDAFLTDDTERLVVRCSFVLDLKPGEIYELHRDRFTGVAEVYRVKRNVLDRLRRNAQLLGLGR